MANHIRPGTTIVGEINSDESIRFDGTLKGNLYSKGRLVVGATGTIEGDVHCVSADISGKIKGKLVVSDLLSLKSTAKVVGEIQTAKLAIEPGAEFNGTCSMNENAASAAALGAKKEAKPSPAK